MEPKLEREEKETACSWSSGLLMHMTESDFHYFTTFTQVT